MKIKKSLTIFATLILVFSISSCKDKKDIDYSKNKEIPLIRFKEEGNLDKVLELRNRELGNLLIDNKEEFIKNKKDRKNKKDKKDKKDLKKDKKIDGEINFSNIKVRFNTEEVLNNPIKSKTKTINIDDKDLKEINQSKDNRESIIYEKAYSRIDEEKFLKEIEEKIDKKLEKFEKGYYINIVNEGNKDNLEKSKYIKYSSKEAKLLKDVLEDTLEKNNLNLEDIKNY